jgi:hypothetical protein
MSQTGIGRIGSSHILTSPQDDALFLLESSMWCTHPFLAGDILSGGSFNITQGKNIVIGTGTEFTLLCNNFTNNNTPLNRYIAYYLDSTGTYGILEVDYVIDDLTLILKTPAFETITIDSVNDLAIQINYYGTPILKEVEISPLDSSFAVPLIMASKYSYIGSTYIIASQRVVANNEGGVEPILITSTNIVTTLKY